MNEDALRKERQEDADEESELAETKTDEDAKNGEDPLFPDQHYNNEVLQVTMDYVNLLRERGKQTAAK